MSGLRRAEDADVHPMLVEDDPVTGAARAPTPGAPLAAAGTASGDTVVRPGKPAKSGEAGKSGKPGEPGKSGKPAKPGKSAKHVETGKSGKSAKHVEAGKSGKPAKPGRPGKRGNRAGAPEGRVPDVAGKRVDLKVSVPKRLRTQVRDMARRRGVSPDEVVEQILEAALDDR